MINNHLFFIATTEETTAILFDPEIFSHSDFFILATNVSNEILGTKMGRNSVSKNKKTKIKDISRLDLIKGTE